MVRNGYAALVRARQPIKGRTSARRKIAQPTVKRRKLDDYETPDAETLALVRNFALAPSILEPACGSGRMVRALRAGLRARYGDIKTKLSIVGTDLKEGPQFDFLKRTAKWKGDIVTNPPYGNGLAEAFTRHALKLADGRVAMLMEGKFLWGSKRAANLFQAYKPALIIILASRIYFLVNGKPIDSQFFSHCWICWPARARREIGNYETKTIWVDTATP